MEEDEQKGRGTAVVRVYQRTGGRDVLYENEWATLDYEEYLHSSAILAASLASIIHLCRGQ